MLDHAALSALNHLLAGAAWAQARLQPFAGRTLRLTLPPLQLDLVVEVDGFLAVTSSDTFDVTIELPAMPQLALRGVDAATKAARIQGSADFADALGFVLRNLRWDYAEDLSKVVGDIAAQRISGQVSHLAGWHQQAARKLTENLAEYFTEEQPVLVKSRDAQDFGMAVKCLREDLETLEHRLVRLEN